MELGGFGGVRRQKNYLTGRSNPYVFFSKYSIFAGLGLIGISGLDESNVFAITITDK